MAKLVDIELMHGIYSQVNVLWSGFYWLCVRCIQDNMQLVGHQ